MRHRLGLALVVLVALSVSFVGCGQPTVTEAPHSPSVTLSPSASPSDSSTVGQFRLDLALAKVAWSAGEPMTGTATLTSTGPSPIVLVGAGSGLIVFDYVEVNGQRRLIGVSTADCAPHPIAPGSPIVAPLAKIGAFAADPSDSWLAQVMAANGVQLPPGVWDVTARTTFYEGECGGASDSILATVRMRVGP